jgi:high-affinity K+ transport system ATPase subunit B
MGAINAIAFDKGTANAIGKQVGVSNIKAELLPQDKLAFIKELRSKYDRVAMVGALDCHICRYGCDTDCHTKWFKTS